MRLRCQDVDWSPLESADIVGAGSLLQWVTKVESKLTHPLHVWGSGYMFDQKPPISSPLVIHDAVRGVKTKAFGKLDNVALGDTGLLADLLVDKPIAKRYTIGIVPHLWHLDNPTLLHLMKKYPEIKLIDVRQNPLDVITQIAECEFVYSSSLHGLIVADSFEIPNQWVQFDVPLFGGVWKFEDYYSVFDNLPEPLLLEQVTFMDSLISGIANEYKRAGLADIKQNLLRAFPYANQ